MHYIHYHKPSLHPSLPNVTSTCTEPDRFNHILAEYGAPNQPLQNRSFDDLVAKAREEKSNVEMLLAMRYPDERMPGWLGSV